MKNELDEIHDIARKAREYTELHFFKGEHQHLVQLLNAIAKRTTLLHALTELEFIDKQMEWEDVLIERLSEVSHKGISYPREARFLLEGRLQMHRKAIQKIESAMA